MKGKRRDIMLCGVMRTGNRDLSEVLFLTAGYDLGLTLKLVDQPTRWLTDNQANWEAGSEAGRQAGRQAGR